ncbi:methionyl-tRNA formyltransferase [Blochmannia endosymbiont of Colobopsis nipponica]|uniref:methionyl-tRNA formyltransferase n=1 Tax=Blochmannia endosymbiont of Colobopsis nipponica TaxID=2681987 RepID=UPI001781B362|nr:methionyl-tRNA formyltransferase [Blochmannia endosymbiont of Colobopsis nipponica]QOI11201.1 methionyl-tRNA formyltransferase [Blochmannia endosymbiont of Colobopsis nipponica]
MSCSLRIIFAGTPDYSACFLRMLFHSPHQVIAILTKKNNKKITIGKKNKLSSNNLVLNFAKEHNIPIFQPKSLNALETFQIIKNLDADIIIVVAYSLIIPQKFLHLPRLGCINIHYSLLPRWRGPAPIQRAIEAGDYETGISVIQMDEGLDTGNILHQVTCNISIYDTYLTLSDKLTKIGAKALIEILNKINYNEYTAIPQNETFASYAKKLSKKEGKINWNLPAIQIERRIRAFSTWPTSYFQISEHMIKIWNATTISPYKKQQKFECNIPGTILASKKTGIDILTGDGILTIQSLQPEGKRTMTVQDFLASRGTWFRPGLVLS